MTAAAREGGREGGVFGVFGGGTNGLIIQGGAAAMPLCGMLFTPALKHPSSQLAGGTEGQRDRERGEEVKGFTYRVLHAPSKIDLQGCAKYKSAREPKHTMFHWLILAHIIFQAESRD